ncbi:MAG: ABC transporter permease, partial [Burkholderiales bacterium]|nr:ABC transporter permease [Burkholderiales bacterium]
MATPSAALPAASRSREIPHTVSPGLWTLAWRRLKADTVGMVSLAIVAAFLLMIVASSTGLVARDWSREVGVNYAPPSFIGADAESGTPASPAAAPEPPIPAAEWKSE